MRSICIVDTPKARFHLIMGMDNDGTYYRWQLVEKAKNKTVTGDLHRENKLSSEFPRFERLLRVNITSRESAPIKQILIYDPNKPGHFKSMTPAKTLSGSIKKVFSGLRPLEMKIRQAEQLYGACKETFDNEECAA